MTCHDQDTLYRLRLWRQIDTLVNELQDRLYEWYDSDPDLDDLYNRLRRSYPHSKQLLLPFMTVCHTPNELPQNCPLCQTKKWP
jgi:hypothetical protein